MASQTKEELLSDVVKAIMAGEISYEELSSCLDNTTEEMKTAVVIVHVLFCKKSHTASFPNYCTFYEEELTPATWISESHKIWKQATLSIMNNLNVTVQELLTAVKKYEGVKLGPVSELFAVWTADHRVLNAAKELAEIVNPMLVQNSNEEEI